MRGRLELVGVAVRAIPFAAAAAPDVGLEVPFQITRDDEVKPAVVIEVHPGGARRPPAGGNPRLPGDFLKRPVPAVPVEDVAAVVGDVKVRAAIVIVIAHRRAHAIAAPAHAGLFRHIAERSVTLVSIEAVPE